MPINTELVDAYARDKNWCYFGGGQYTTKFQKCKKAHHYNYFMMAWKDHGFTHQPYIGHEEWCVCNTPITQQCYIINRETKEVVVLGNCCIEKLNLSGRTCGLCHVKHKNRSDNYCSPCRIVRKKQEEDDKQAAELIEYNKSRCIEEGCSRKRCNATWGVRCSTCYYTNIARRA